jgi:uncharacterized peroxidase-related enzyme
MPYVHPLSDEQASEPTKHLFGAIKHQFGMVPNIYRTMGHSPDVLDAALQLSAAVQTDLPGNLRELAYLRASVTNGCQYCSHYHRMLAMKAGASERQADEIDRFDQSDAFTPQEKTVLLFTEQLTQRADVDPSVASAVREFLSESQYVTLVATIGLANFTNRFNHACGVELP